MQDRNWYQLAMLIAAVVACAAAVIGLFIPPLYDILKDMLKRDDPVAVTMATHDATDEADPTALEVTTWTATTTRPTPALDSTPSRSTETPTTVPPAGSQSVVTAPTGPTTTGTLIPSPRPTWPALALLEPESGAHFQERSAQIIFRWSGVGQLADDEFYVLQIDHGQGLDEIWTRDTFWSIQQHDPYLGQSHVYLVELEVRAWRVVIKRQTGLGTDGRPVGTPIGAPSEKWAITWSSPPVPTLSKKGPAPTPVVTEPPGL